MEWFSVDKTGLAKLLERRGKAFVVLELISNCWDTKATRVEIRLDPIAGRPAVAIRVVDDNAQGFTNLTHAWGHCSPNRTRRAKHQNAAASTSGRSWCWRCARKRKS